MPNEPETFTMPVPPPFPPHGPHAHDVLYFRAGEGAAEPGAREHEDIMLRRVPRETAMRFRAGSRRALPHARPIPVGARDVARARAGARGRR